MSFLERLCLSSCVLVSLQVSLPLLKSYRLSVWSTCLCIHHCLSSNAIVSDFASMSLLARSSLSICAIVSPHTQLSLLVLHLFSSCTIVFCDTHLNHLSMSVIFSLIPDDFVSPQLLPGMRKRWILVPLPPLPLPRFRIPGCHCVSSSVIVVPWALLSLFLMPLCFCHMTRWVLETIRSFVCTFARTAPHRSLICSLRTARFGLARAPSFARSLAHSLLQIECVDFFLVSPGPLHCSVLTFLTPYKKGKVTMIAPGGPEKGGVRVPGDFR